ncbi:MAG: efflux transporter outer membrane subunit [Pseudomonadota bacterium]
MKRSSIFLGAVLATGCSTIRDATTPVEIDAVAPDAPEQWAAAGVAGKAEQSDWLAGFNDDVLTTLVEEALANNPTLDAQIATRQAFIEDARAQRGTLFPQIDGRFEAGAQRSVQIFAGEVVDFQNAVWGVGLSGSWEADLWGRLRTGIRIADTERLITETDLAGARLSIAAQTAISWVQLNSAIAQERVAEATLEARQRTQFLTERRLARGLSTALDVRLSRTTTFQAEASLAAQQRIRADAARSLEVLLGRYPSAEIDAPAVLPSLEPIEAILSPADLLARRPDVAAAEARVMAAGLRAEDARLALFPSLRIDAFYGTSQDTIRRAFDPELAAQRAIGNLVQPLFTGGQLRARKRAAIARAEASLSDYASSVLTAWREVEDAFAADAFLAREEAAQFRALEEAREAELLAERQYQNGLISIFELIDAQTRRLNSEAALVTARTQRAVNRVEYHLALGGGVPATYGGLPDGMAKAIEVSETP